MSLPLGRHAAFDALAEFRPRPERSAPAETERWLRDSLRRSCLRCADGSIDAGAAAAARAVVDRKLFRQMRWF